MNPFPFAASLDLRSFASWRPRRLRLRFSPGAWISDFILSNQFFNIRWQGEFGMGCRKEQNVRANFRPLRIFCVDLPASGEENSEIEDNQGDGDHRPAAALHVFMAQRNQHRTSLSDRNAAEE